MIYLCRLSWPKRNKRQEMHTGRFSWPLRDRQGSGRSVLLGWWWGVQPFTSILSMKKLLLNLEEPSQIQSASLVKMHKLLQNFTFGWLKGRVRKAGVERGRLGTEPFFILWDHPPFTKRTFRLGVQ